METEAEFTGRYQDGWVSRRFILPLRNIKKESVLHIHGRRFPYPQQLTISIYVNGELLHQAVNPDSSFAISCAMPPVRRGELQIVASDYFIPKEKGINEDVRKLSFYLDEVIIPGLPDMISSYKHLFAFTPSKQVYFLDEEIWDAIAFELPDSYRIPSAKMMKPLQESEWWEAIQPLPSAVIQGKLYDKFTGQAVRQAKVRLKEAEGDILQEGLAPEGSYLFADVPPGEYLVIGSAEGYGEQQIRVKKDKTAQVIHLPMLPLV